MNVSDPPQIPSSASMSVFALPRCPCTSDNVRVNPEFPRVFRYSATSVFFGHKRPARRCLRSRSSTFKWVSITDQGRCIMLAIPAGYNHCVMWGCRTDSWEFGGICPSSKLMKSWEKVRRFRFDGSPCCREPEPRLQGCEYRS